jgi:hypothetical protein
MSVRIFFVAVEDPCPFVAVNVTSYSLPVSVNVCITGLPAFTGLPSPKSHERPVGAPEDLSVNVTVSGDNPSSGVAVKSAIGGLLTKIV